MIRRQPIIMLIAVIVVLVAGFAGSQVVLAQINQAPEQPIGYTHKTHAGDLGIACTFCHRNADKGANASVPAVQQCMFCHSVVTGESTQAKNEIAKVRAAFANERPLDWRRIHRLPDHVRFVHQAHISAGFTCATCHGDVASTTKVAQVRKLKMGDCVACHRTNSAPTDCTTCHK